MRALENMRCLGTDPLNAAYRVRQKNAPSV